MEEFIFEFEKNAIMIGMPINDFWESNPQRFFAYLDIYTSKQEETQKSKDYYCWLQGLYNLQAQRQVMGESFSKSKQKVFPEICFSEKTRKDNMTLTEKGLAWLNQFNARFEKEKK